MPQGWKESTQGKLCASYSCFLARLKIPSPLFYIGWMIAFFPDIRRSDWSACLWSFGIGNRAG